MSNEPVKNNGENNDYTFLQEKIKDRPINRKKVFKQSLITSAIAVVFAVCACFLFFFIEKKYVTDHSNEQPEKVKITLQETADEIIPSNLPMEEDLQEDYSDSQNSTSISDAATKYDFQISDYQSVYTKMRDLAYETNKSLVSVIGISDSTDWLKNPYETTSKTTGLIVEDDGTNLLILVKADPVRQANDINITFYNSEECNATLKAIDNSTNLAIVSVPLSSVSDDTISSIKYASFGNSSVNSKPGELVIATGDPLGYGSSIGYGIITSSGSEVSMQDYNFTLITTDIFGSVNANGVLINQRGKIIGIINQSYNRNEFSNQVSAIGISELKEVIENLCNDTLRPHLGLNVTDVTPVAKSNYNIPSGAYITNIAMDSPAMLSGIHKGDVVVALNDAVVYSVNDYENELKAYTPGDTVVVTIMRKNGDTYVSMDIKVTLE